MIRSRVKIVVSGVSESHLDSAITALQRTCEADFNVGAPQVAYREKLAKPIEIDQTYKKLTDNAGQFARVKMTFEPVALGAGSNFQSKIIGGVVPKEFIPSIEKGFNDALKSGLLGGFPVVDVRATLVDGAFHDADSSPLAFEICARLAFRRALERGGEILLEPIMKVEVTTPEEFTGAVIGDLKSRRSQIQGRDMRGNTIIIRALVPLANTFGYNNQLRTLSQGMARVSMEFSHYAPVPPPDNGPFSPAIGMRA